MANNRKSHRRDQIFCAIIIALSLLGGGWLVFDGVHAMTTGDYVTPDSGEFVGQLGPWSKVVAFAGLAPRSSLMHWVHVIVGWAWLAGLTCYLLRIHRGRMLLMLGAATALWYLPFGAILSIAVIVLARSISPEVSTTND